MNYNKSLGACDTTISVVEWDWEPEIFLVHVCFCFLCKIQVKIASYIWVISQNVPSLVKIDVLIVVYKTHIPNVCPIGHSTHTHLIEYKSRASHLGWKEFQDG